MPALKDTDQGHSTDHCSSAAPCRQAQGVRAPGKEKSDAADVAAGTQREEQAEAGYRPTCKTTEIHNAVLALYPMTSAAPLQKGASFVTEILVWSTQADSQIYQGW